MEREDSVPDLFQKYLIEICIFGSKYYTVWGADVSQNGDDKLLVGKSGEILVYTDLQKLRKHLFENQDLYFDFSNFVQWLQKYSFEDFHSSFDFNILENQVSIIAESINHKKREVLMGLLNNINLVLDYAYQTRDTLLIDLSKKDEVLLFKDFVYGRYFWSSDQENGNYKFETETQLYSEKLSITLELIYGQFKNRIKVID
jgi:hypothetical protein